jgi:hypothetical protein
VLTTNSTEENKKVKIIKLTGASYSNNKATTKRKKQCK